jgi:transposase
MIQVTPQMRILVAVEPADFRKGIDGLAQVGQLRGDIGVVDGARADFGRKLLTTFGFLVVPCWLSQAGG